MNLQIRDKRDPFTQALAFLFRSEENVLTLRRKLHKEMISLVTQVAVKIGGIDTEKAVRDRALAVFTGIVSLYLMNLTKGSNNPEEWSRIVSSGDLRILFQRGYTMIHEILHGRWKLEIEKDGKRIFYETRTERLEQFAVHRINDQWAGYILYLKEATSLKEEILWSEFANWLKDDYSGKREHRRISEQSLFHEGELFEEGEIIRRVFYYILHSGKPSFIMNFRIAREIVDHAQKDKKWLQKATINYSRFVTSLPLRFQECFLYQVREDEPGNSIMSEVSSVWRNVKWICRKRKHSNRSEAIDSVCINTGVPSPGLSKSNRTTFE